MNFKYLVGGGVYFDFWNNDVCLVIENIKKVYENGGIMVSYVKVIGFLYDDDGWINGIIVEDLLIGVLFEIYVWIVINMIGLWLDMICKMDYIEKY